METGKECMANNSSEELPRNVDILRSSDDPESLERAAVALASSGDPTAIAELGQFLRSSQFLYKLDDLTDPDVKTLHLREVMAALESHPNATVGELCVELSRDSNFMSDEDRMDFLLEALSSVRPMTDEGVDLFRQTNEDGYFAFNAPLLVKNGSPRALELFESMMADHTVPENRRIDSLHRSLLPYRTTLPVLHSVERLVVADLEHAVAIGLVETIFDYQSKPWFGPAIGAPRPPAWENASDEALHLILRLAAMAKERLDLPQPVAAAMEETVKTIENILESRKE
ncbi:MAG: hypothetical protein DMG14_30295 [Acidobacteria bacterium]|nr:MAG: hypothetical protein DMG14_30295 [Acidobacteriota bacterium]